MPTVADLRARRIEMTKASLRETILAGDLDQFRAVVDSLAQEFDIMDVAAAAVKHREKRGFRRRGNRGGGTGGAPTRTRRSSGRARRSREAREAARTSWRGSTSAAGAS